MTYKGIALIQVLLITAVISLLALYFSQTARQQLQLAKLAQDSAEAHIALKTAQSRLLFALLTEYRDSSMGALDGISRDWNFYRHPFAMGDGVEVTIQDQNGLMAINFHDPDLLQQIFRQNNWGPGTATIISDSLLDWVDADKLTRLNGAEDQAYGLGPRDGNISLKEELQWVKGMTPSALASLSPIMTLYRRGPFNPVTAPPELLAGLIGRDRAMEIAQRRLLEGVDMKKFAEISGLDESTEMIFYPGDALEICISASLGDVRINKKLMIEVDPYTDNGIHPVDYLEVRWQSECLIN